jgi:hypothetical protein
MVPAMLLASALLAAVAAPAAGKPPAPAAPAAALLEAAHFCERAVKGGNISIDGDVVFHLAGIPKMDVPGPVKRFGEHVSWAPIDPVKAYIEICSTAGSAWVVTSSRVGACDIAFTGATEDLGPSLAAALAPRRAGAWSPRKSARRPSRSADICWRSWSRRRTIPLSASSSTSAAPRSRRSPIRSRRRRASSPATSPSLPPCRRPPPPRRNPDPPPHQPATARRLGNCQSFPLIHPSDQ